MNRMWTSMFNKKDAAVARPVLAPVVPVAPAPPRRSINPILPLCCLGLILFLIAGTIVLALIPVYLKSRDVRVNPLTAQFTTNILLRNGYLPVGPLSAANCATIQNFIRQRAATNNAIRGSIPSVTSCTVLGNSTQPVKRKRRQAQAVGNLINLVVNVPSTNCFFNACILNRAQALINLLFGLGNFNLALILANGSVFNFLAAFIASSAVTVNPGGVGTTTTTTTTTTTPAVNPLNIGFYGITGANQLLLYNALNPGNIIRTTPITGTANNNADIITNIDFRPATGQLYGTSNRNLYIINEVTGVARLVGQIEPTGNIRSMEFDPAFDILRVVTSVEAPPVAATTLTASTVDPDDGLTIPVIDGREANIEVGTSVGYSNNVAGAATTTLFIINQPTSALFRVEQQTGAVRTQVGTGLGATITETIGFDITSNGVAIACVRIGTDFVLFAVNVNTGVFSQRLGNVNGALVSLAIATERVAYAIAPNALTLFFVNFLTAGPLVNQKTIVLPAPLQVPPATEFFLAIDLRAADTQLYGVTTQNRLLTIDLGTAEAAVLNPVVAITPIPGDPIVAIDCLPTAAQIRAVTAGRRTFLINIGGGAQGGTVTLTPTEVTINNVAYSNNFFGATTTIIYYITTVTATGVSQLNIQADGALAPLTLPRPLGIAAQSTINGFDISSRITAAGNPPTIVNTAVGLFTVGGSTGLWTINLDTGVATRILDSGLANTIRSFTLSFNF